MPCPWCPPTTAKWMADNLKNAFIINVVLAVFNMLPIPPLDGGRVAVGLLPNVLAYPLSRLEPYGMLILIGLLIVLPLAGSQFGLNLDVISAIVRTLDRLRDPFTSRIDRQSVVLNRSCTQGRRRQGLRPI